VFFDLRQRLCCRRCRRCPLSLLPLLSLLSFANVAIAGRHVAAIDGSRDGFLRAPDRRCIPRGHSFFQVCSVDGVCDVWTVAGLAVGLTIVQVSAMSSRQRV
jgi:hypothetical protein